MRRGRIFPKVDEHLEGAQFQGAFAKVFQVSPTPAVSHEAREDDGSTAFRCRTRMSAGVPHALALLNLAAQLDERSGLPGGEVGDGRLERLLPGAWRPRDVTGLCP